MQVRLYANADISEVHQHQLTLNLRYIVYSTLTHLVWACLAVPVRLDC